MLLGPIFWKEVRDEPKRKKLFHYLFGYVAMLSGFAWICSLTGVGKEGSTYDFGRLILAFVSWSQLFVGLLLAPIMCAATICDEKDHNSLEVLLLTLLSDREIVLGKFTSRLMAIELFLLCGLPISGLVLSMGGITFGEMFACLSFVASAVLLAAATGMLCGTLFEKTYTAGFMAYALFFVWSILPILLQGFPPFAFDAGPVQSLYVLLHTTTVPVWTHSVWYTIALSTILLMIAIRKLNSASVSRVWKIGSLGIGSLMRWTFSRLPERFQFPPPQPVSAQDAVVWRELRGKSPRNSPFLFIVYGIAGVSFVFVCLALVTLPLQVAAPYLFLPFLGTALIVFATTSGALSFVQEKEKQSIELILLSPLEPELIVDGKIKGIHRSLLSLLAIMAGMTAVYHVACQIRKPQTEPYWLMDDLGWFFSMWFVLRLYTILAIEKSLQSRSSLQAITQALLRMGACFIISIPCSACLVSLNPFLYGWRIYHSLGSGATPVDIGISLTSIVGIAFSWLFAERMAAQARARILAFYDRDVTQDPEMWLWREQGPLRVQWRQ